MANTTVSEDSFTRRSAIVVGLVALVALGIALLVQVISVLLLFFTASLAAICLDGLTRLIADRTPLNRTWSLGLVFVLLIAAATIFVWLAGPPFASQVSELRQRVPQAFARISDDLLRFEWFQSVWANVPSVQELTAAGGGVMGRVTTVFSTAFGAGASILFVAALGVYLAINPDLYTRSMIRLVPKGARARTDEVLASLGRALRWWLVGRFAAMTAVGLLTMIGLMLVDVPLAITLGLLAGILSFVPYVGPIASAVPAVLIALVESPLTALWVVAIFVGVQLVEGNVITPLIQRHAVRIPPVALLAAQMTFAVLFGIVGVLLATPLAVAIIVLVQMLYVEDILQDRVAVLGGP